jgi:hypothetical protein
MGPRVAGLGAERSLATPARWRDRLERTWGVTLRTPPSQLDAELARCLAEWEDGLANIDFPEVTDEDRVTFLEHVVSWQIRRALRAGRFDLALAVRALGTRRVAELVERQLGFRPVLIHGTPGIPGPERAPGSRGLRASRGSRT